MSGNLLKALEPGYPTHRFPDFCSLVRSEEFTALAADPDYVWRGQEQNWVLKPGIYRTHSRFDYGFQELLTKQLDLLAKNLHAVAEDTSIVSAPLPVRLVAAQHLGLLTPCLDWTESAWIGLFFSSAQEADLPSASLRYLFALNRKSSRRVSSADSEWHNQGLVLVDRSDIEKHISGDSFKKAWIRRMTGQSGCVTIVGRAGGRSGVESHIAKTFTGADNDKPFLVGFSFYEPDLRHRIELLNLLSSDYSIDHLKLFPDLAGIAKDIRLRVSLTGYKGSNPQYYSSPKDPFSPEATL